MPHRVVDEEAETDDRRAPLDDGIDDDRQHGDADDRRQRCDDADGSVHRATAAQIPRCDEGRPGIEKRDDGPNAVFAGAHCATARA